MKAMKKKATKKKSLKVTKGQQQRGAAAAGAIRNIVKNMAERGTRNLKPGLIEVIKKAAPKVKENTLWNWFRDGVTTALENWRGENRLSKLHMVRVENTASSGYPDVEACYSGTGFVAELKTLARPELQDKRKAPMLSIPHFTTAQALFLDARWLSGERSWLFVQVGDTRYLVPGNKASEFLKPFKETALMKASIETLLGDTAMDFLLAMVGR